MVGNYVEHTIHSFDFKLAENHGVLTVCLRQL